MVGASVSSQVTTVNGRLVPLCWSDWWQQETFLKVPPFSKESPQGSYTGHQHERNKNMPLIMTPYRWPVYEIAGAGFKPCQKFTKTFLKLGCCYDPHPQTNRNEATNDVLQNTKRNWCRTKGLIFQMYDVLQLSWRWVGCSIRRKADGRWWSSSISFKSQMWHRCQTLLCSHFSHLLHFCIHFK